MDDLAPPPYDQKSPIQPWTEPARPSLATSLTEARAEINEKVVVNSIVPYLHAAALEGVAHTRLVLLPHAGQDSDIKLPDGPGGGHMLGFPSHLSIRVIYLPDSTGSMDFWRQNNVLPELVLRLKHALLSAGDNVRMKEPDTTVVAPRPVDLPSPSSGRSFFKRKPSKPKSDVQGVDLSISRVKARLNPGEIDISAQLQDISYRTTTEMGLYETRSDRVVVVSMEIGTSEQS